LRFLSRQHWFLGDRLKAERFAVEAIEVLAALPPSRDLAMAYSNLSQLGMLKGQVGVAVEYGEKAAAMARALSDVEVESHALNNMGAARSTAGDLAGVLELERSLELARANDLHEHVARAYVNLATGAMRRQVVLPTRRYLQEGLAYCEERDLDAWTTYLRVNLARFDMDRGDWDRAGATAARLLKDSTTTAITRIPALVVLAQLHLRRGVPDAGALLEEALALALPTGEVQRIGPVAAVRAEAAWIRGDLPAVVREADQGLAWAMAERGSWLAGELLFWKSRAGPAPEVPAWVCAPYRFAITGDWKAAAAGFAEHEMPYEQALLLAQGDREAIARSRHRLTQLGAGAIIAALSRERTTK
jgi:tetratricopeptide (TPR) repeat protein